LKRFLDTLLYRQIAQKTYYPATGFLGWILCWFSATHFRSCTF